MTALVVVLLVLLVVLALVVAALAIPLGVLVATAPGQRLVVEVTWLFGLVRVRPTSGRTRRGAARPPKEPRREREERRARPRAGALARGWAALTSPGLLSRALRLVIDVLRMATPRSIRGSARVGLDDPADTGMLWGALGPVSAALQALPRTSVTLEPDFTRARFDVEGEIDVVFVPLALVGTVLAFLFSPAVVRAAFAAVRA